MDDVHSFTVFYEVQDDDVAGLANYEIHSFVKEIE